VINEFNDKKEQGLGYYRKMIITPTIKRVTRGNFVEQSHFARHYEAQSISNAMLSIQFTEEDEEQPLALSGR